MRKQYSANLKAQLVLEVLKVEKALSQIASEHSVHPNQLRRWKSQAVDGLPNVFADEQRAMRELKATHERELDELYTEIGRLTTQLAWLKKNLALSLSRDERLAMIEYQNRDLSLTLQADLLGFNRTGLYYQPVPPPAAEVALKHRIDELYTAPPFYGSRRITMELNREGILINRKAVQRHMREMCIAGILPGP